MVTPQGHVLTCIQVLAGVRNGHGARPGRIWIEEPVLLVDSASIVVARYQEWQQEAANTTGRLSTVVFERDGATPNGLRWLSVHETWLDADRSATR